MIPQTVTDTEEKVKDALDTWSKWMRRPNQSMGYGQSVGFESGGSVSGWEDFEQRVEKNMAINVQAIYEGLKHPQQMAIDHFHLSAVWKPQRYRIEDAYADALIAIEIALRRRGLI
jgi:hypothetical protein